MNEFDELANLNIEGIELNKPKGSICAKSYDDNVVKVEIDANITEALVLIVNQVKRIETMTGVPAARLFDICKLSLSETRDSDKGGTDSGNKKC